MKSPTTIVNRQTFLCCDFVETPDFFVVAVVVVDTVLFFLVLSSPRLHSRRKETYPNTHYGALVQRGVKRCAVPCGR